MESEEQERAHVLARHIIRFTDTLVSDFDLDAFLADLCETAVELFDAASAVVLVSTDPDAEELDVLAASDAQDLRLGEHEQTTGEGPATEARTRGEAIGEGELSAHGKRRWPEFADSAAEVGHRSLLAVPLRLRDRRIGALELMWSQPVRLAEQQRALLQSLADSATIGILHAHTVEELAELTGQLQQALDSRVSIEQAKGLLVGRYGGTTQEAFETMRREARNRKMKLHDLAREIIARMESSRPGAPPSSPNPRARPPEA